MRNLLCRAATGLLLPLMVTAAAAAAPQDLIETIQAVGEKGEGNVAASKAVRELSQEDANVLPQILTALNDAGPLAANWLRGAVEAIADRSLSRGETLPADKLEEFVLNHDNHPRARRLAFEYLIKVDETAFDRLVPGMIDDPSSELRREAVARLIDQAAEIDPKQDPERAIALYRKALQGAIDDDQVKAIVNPLKKLGVEVNLHRHFGFLTDWRMIGPFNNRDKVGFEAVYPPEKEIDLQSTYKGQLGEVRWQPVSLSWEESTTNNDRYGVIDIGKQLENYKGSVMYAVTGFHSPRPQNVQIRLGTPNAWKLWVNGEFLFGHEEYHRGMKLDQYRVDAALKPGRNVILLKICQNEQPQDWAQRYQFQLRVSDPEGAAILSQPAPQTGPQRQKLSHGRKRKAGIFFLGR